jgi:hypothetical protein
MSVVLVNGHLHALVMRQFHFYPTPNKWVWSATSLRFSSVHSDHIISVCNCAIAAQDELQKHMVTAYGSSSPSIAWAQINHLLGQLGDPYTRRIDSE